MNPSVFLIGFVFVLDIYGFTVFMTCRRLSKQVTFWIKNFFIADALSCIFDMVWRLITGYCNGCDPAVYRLFSGTMKMGYHVAMISTTVLAFDRLFSLVYSMRYHEFVTTRRQWLCVAGIYIIGLVSAITVLFGDLEQFGPVMTSRNITEAASWTSHILMLTFSMLTAIIHCIVGCITLRKEREVSSRNGSRENEYSRFWKVTAKSFAIVLLYVLCVALPTLLQFLKMLGYRATENGSLPVILILGLVMFAGRTCIPVLFVLSYFESRHRVIMMLPCLSQEYRSRLETKINHRYATFTIGTRTNTQI